MQGIKDDMATGTKDKQCGHALQGVALKGLALKCLWADKEVVFFILQRLSGIDSCRTQTKSGAAN